MNINLYYPCRPDNGGGGGGAVVTFTLMHALNSAVVFVFGIDNATAARRTQLVSGYETSNHRRINMNMATVVNDNAGDGYIISCVRLPYVSTKLMTADAFTAPPAVVVVKCGRDIEAWHVFAVRKRAERASLNKITGVYVAESDREVFYEKELIRLTGNVPAAFVATLTKHINHVRDVDVGAFLYADLKINDCDIRLAYAT